MIAYFDCFSGISGDMTLGALVDLGVPVEWIREELSVMPLSGFDLAASTIHRMGIHATQVKVSDTEDRSSRNFADIRQIIESSPLPERVVETSLAVFRRIAEAEADIHNQEIEKVHFHEVGGIDAIVDIVGTALCIDYLGIDRVIASPVALGKGFTTCRHGVIPIPAPATLAILKGIPTYGTDVPKELTTPTGAGIVSTLASDFRELPPMKIDKIGYGAGQRELESRPNLLRIITGAAMASDVYQGDEIVVVETSIDDMNPEFFGYVMDRLFEDGALDVSWAPVYMKKNRPGTMIQVLCRQEVRDIIIDRLLVETTSIGVRFYEAKRRILSRDIRDIESSYGRIQVKCVTYPDGATRMVPEYEVCKALALERKLPIRVVYDTICRDICDQV